MWKSIAIAALALSVSGAAMAQSGSGSSGGGASSSQGSVGGGSLPGTTDRSRTAPGSGRATGRPALPPGPSAAEQTRRSSGTVDLNRNSATGVMPQTAPGVDGTTGSGSMNRAPLAPLGPGTGARDTGVPDSGVYNPGVQK